MSEGETTTDERQITLREGIGPWTGWLEGYRWLWVRDGHPAHPKVQEMRYVERSTRQEDVHPG